MTVIVNLKDVIGAVILCAMSVACLALFAIAVIGEKVRKFKEDCKKNERGGGNGRQTLRQTDCH